MLDRPTLANAVCLLCWIIHHCRFEVYCGKKQHTADDSTDLDAHTGASAVLRNLNFVVPTVSEDWHVIVTDRFYTSVQLALQLLHRQVYIAGTVMTNRLGLSKTIAEYKKTKARDRVRGDSVMAVSKDYPSMTMLAWMDSKPVFFLTTGGSRKPQQISKYNGVYYYDIVLTDLLYT